MGKILIPARGPEDWQQFLAEPDKQWKRGYSARTLAYCWHDCDGFPAHVKKAFLSSEHFCDLNLLVAIPEHQVPLPPYNAPASQNDIWILARCATGLVSVAVEGKVSESFDKTLSEWNVKPSNGKTRRLDYLTSILGLERELPGTIRYQLLHRTASAVIEAKRFSARHAVMLVHSFSQEDIWFSDYAAFVSLFGGIGVMDKIVAVRELDGVLLHFGWVRGEAKYLTM
ncbi:MAG: hypothetical protein IH577_01800 [Deltaproteobacteria bacterium]|nr:hypothetical protein [Deltaproteobacteria bacterium]